MKQTKRNRDVSEVVLHFSVNVGRGKKYGFIDFFSALTLLIFVFIYFILDFVTKGNRIIKKLSYIWILKELFLNSEFYVRVDPAECVVNPGNEIKLKANVNCEDPSQFTYEWHFIDLDLAKTESKIES